MIKSIILTFFLALASVVTYAQSAFGAQTSLSLESEGAVVKAAWQAEEHNFGPIPQGKPASFTFEVLNEGTQPLEIKRVKPSCGCTATDYTQEPIQPGERGYVKATYEAKNPGYFSKTIVVTTNDDEFPNLTLRLKGEVEAN